MRTKNDVNKPGRGIGETNTTVKAGRPATLRSRRCVIALLAIVVAASIVVQPVINTSARIVGSSVAPPPVMILGSPAASYIKAIISDAFSKYIGDHVLNALKAFKFDANPKQEVAFAKPRRDLIRSLAIYQGEFWNEDQRQSNTRLRELFGEFREVGSFEQTGFNGTGYNQTTALDAEILARGDKGIVPVEYLDGDEYHPEEFFRDRKMDLYKFKVGDHEEDKTASVQFGLGYNEAPDDLHTFKGYRMKWDTGYQVFVDVGKNAPDPAKPIAFVNKKVFPVAVVFKLADITPQLQQSFGDEIELVLQLKSRNRFNKKVFFQPTNMPSRVSVPVLDYNTQLISSDVLGGAVAFFKKSFNPLGIFGSTKGEFIEEFIPVNEIDFN
jgi:hypothetical protein